MSKRLRQGLYSVGLLLFTTALLGCNGEPALQVEGVPDAVPEPAPTVNYLSHDGVYHVATYTELPATDAYFDATVFYPANKPEPFGAVAISPGFMENQSHMQWWGPRLASHGFAVLIFDTNEPRDYPIVRAEALITAVEILRGENRRDDSPLQGQLDEDKMAVMGHSMGGGGALLAANEHSDKLAAAIAFTSWQPDADFSKIAVPTLVIAAEADQIADVSEQAWPHYQSIPETTPKVFLEFANGNHFIGNTERSNLEVHGELSRYVIAWLKLYLDKDTAYREFIFGDIPQRDDDKLSRYITNKAAQ